VAAAEATNKPLQLYLEASRAATCAAEVRILVHPALAKNGRDPSWPILSRMGDFFAAAAEVYVRLRRDVSLPELRR
jgi:hypothetical protein